MFRSEKVRQPGNPVFAHHFVNRIEVLEKTSTKKKTKKRLTSKMEYISNQSMVKNKNDFKL